MQGEAQDALDYAVDDTFSAHGKTAQLTLGDGSTRPVTVVRTTNYLGSSPLGAEIENDADVLLIAESEAHGIERGCWVTMNGQEQRQISFIKPHLSRKYLRLTLTDI